MDWPKYVCIKNTDIPQEFIEEYNLTQLVQNWWIYFEILWCCYGLPQSGRLANDLLHTHLKKSAYYKAATTPGIWRHTWRPIKFSLIADDVGIEYFVKQHALHLLNILEQNYDITANWEGEKFSGIDLAWDYDDQHVKRTWRIYMNEYIDKLLMKYGHSQPSKAQLSPHKHSEVTYGEKE